MANQTPHTTEKSATERLIAARAVKDDAVAREIAWVAIVVHAKIWPAWVSPPLRPQAGFPYVLNMETPAGRLIYRLAKDELEMFRHIDERPNDGIGGGAADKLAILSHLAMDGWED
jgi:hypothetical protein